MHNKLSLLSLLIISMLCASVATADDTSGNFAGNEQNVSKYVGKGKWLVVMIWASDCHVCNKEAHQYVEFHKQHKDKDAQVLGISMDGKEKLADAKSFLQRHNPNFPNLIGEPMNVAKMYQNSTGANWVGTPTFMVFNPKGKLIGAQAGAVPVSIIESFIERESTAPPPPKS